MEQSQIQAAQDLVDSQCNLPQFSNAKPLFEARDILRADDFEQRIRLEKFKALFGGDVENEFYDSEQAVSLGSFEKLPGFQDLLAEIEAMVDDFMDGENPESITRNAPLPADALESKKGIWDVIAWYVPFHFDRYDWGIYMRHDGLKWLAGQLLRHWSRLGRPLNRKTLPGLLLKGAYSSLFAHEHFHHRVESMATRLEYTLRYPLYQPYTDIVYEPALGTDAVLEEALANTYMVNAQASMLRRHKPLARIVQDYHKSNMDQQPPGYRDAERILELGLFTEECSRLMSQIQHGLGGTFTPSALVHTLLLPLHHCRNRVTLVQSPGALSQGSRPALRCPQCGFRKYAHLAWGGIWLGPNNPLPKTRSELEREWDQGKIPRIDMGDMNTGEHYSCINCGHMWK